MFMGCGVMAERLDPSIKLFCFLGFILLIIFLICLLFMGCGVMAERLDPSIKLSVFWGLF